MKKLYKVGNRDIEELDTYADHVHAMTGEKLHGKSDIAAELAFRDARIAELTNENEALSEALDFEREHSESKITELESVADNQIWPSIGDGWSADYVRGYEQATHDMARKLKGGDV